MLSHGLLADASFHRALLAIDVELAAETKAKGCVCGGKLHVANYPRDPRGLPDDLKWGKRFSFCCAREDCRRRATPTSVRFLDRRVYTGVAVVLAAVLAQGVSGPRLRMLRGRIRVKRRTLERWRRWWREIMPRTDFWSQLRGRFDRPVEEAELPASLLARIGGTDEADRLQRLLNLLRPLSHSELMRQRFTRAA